MGIKEINQHDFSESVLKAFAAHRQMVGEQWNWEYAITEANAEDFAKDLLTRLGIKVEA